VRTRVRRAADRILSSEPTYWCRCACTRFVRTCVTSHATERDVAAGAGGATSARNRRAALSSEDVDGSAFAESISGSAVASPAAVTTTMRMNSAAGPETSCAQEQQDADGSPPLGSCATSLSTKLHAQLLGLPAQQSTSLCERHQSVDLARESSRTRDLVQFDDVSKNDVIESHASTHAAAFQE
jgi:hypothetical protein